MPKEVKTSVETTERQKQAFKGIVLDKGRNKGKELKKAGYSEGIQKQPSRVTKSKGWQELLEQYLPDDDLTRVQKEGLRATVKGKPDYSVRHKYLDTGLKLKAKYPAERKDISIHTPKPILKDYIDAKVSKEDKDIVVADE